MIERAAQNMAVTPATLDQRDTEPKRKGASQDDLKARLEAARAMAFPEDVHCRDCFAKGRDAVIRLLEGKGDQ